jgi:hypothetical protein
MTRRFDPGHTSSGHIFVDPTITIATSQQTQFPHNLSEESPSSANITSTMTSMTTMLLLTLLLALSMASVTAEAQCACTFQVPEDDEPECAIYGQDNNGTRVEFDRISEQCLAGLEINERVLEVDRQFRICPYANETDVSITQFITYLKLYDTTAVNAIKSNPDFARYFQTKVDGSMDIVDNIVTDSGVTFVCTQNPALCWNEIKVFFSLEIYRVGAICEDLYEQQTNALQTEQSMARSMICEISEAEAFLPAACAEIETQIQSFMASNPELQCSELEVRAAASMLPNNETCNLGESLTTQDRSGAASWAADWGSSIMSLVVLMGLLTLQ